MSLFWLALYITDSCSRDIYMSVFVLLYDVLCQLTFVMQQCLLISTC